MTDDTPKAYRFLTGSDDAKFCQRVSDACATAMCFTARRFCRWTRRAIGIAGRRLCCPNLRPQKRCYRFRKLSGKPGASHCVFTKRPVDDRVISGAQIIAAKTNIGCHAVIGRHMGNRSVFGEMREMPPLAMVATATVPSASTASESK